MIDLSRVIYETLTRNGGKVSQLQCAVIEWPAPRGYPDGTKFIVYKLDGGEDDYAIDDHEVDIILWSYGSKTSHEDPRALSAGIYETLHGPANELVETSAGTYCAGRRMSMPEFAYDDNQWPVVIDRYTCTIKGYDEDSVV
jgi:hypothetical protein